jgi:predicted ATPase/class 3 adenylate cyclase/DNA-binding CsgD family transcriptional regulator
MGYIPYLGDVPSERRVDGVDMATDGELGAQMHLPAGTVSFLLTDIEGSTRLWEDEPLAMAQAVARHYELIDEAVNAAAGARPVEQGEGDSAVAAFGRASDAVTAAVALQRALCAERWPTSSPLLVRMAIHTGEARMRDTGNYMGEAIIRTARLRSVAHGGQILVSAPAYTVAIDRLGDQFAFRDLGVHRLKDLARPEHIFQVCAPGLAEVFPELRSLDTHPHNLPVQLSPFVGRVEEITTVARLLNEHRLVTLCGSGGVGKTRMAQQAAAEVVENFPDGVWWVELAPIEASDAVVSTVAAVLNVVDRASSDVWSGVARMIGRQRMLLVLDNCEHVIDAVAVAAASLLQLCPGLTVLATSRASLEVPGEVAWRVPPLALPAEQPPAVLDVLMHCDAVRLFSQRASRARPNFRLGDDNAATVAEICRKLDGVALAIELAAARVRTLTPHQILRGLDDALVLLTGGGRNVLPRQQTLEASIRWSYTLLDERERILLRRLTAFRGGFSLDAAEHVAADDALQVASVLDCLDHLIDQSLVVVDSIETEARYRLLETVRQFGARQLTSLEETAVHDRHAEFFAMLAKTLGPRLLSEDMVESLGLLRIESANLAAALNWLTQQRHADLIDTVVETGWYWAATGRLREGETWFTHCLELDSCVDRTRARLLFGRAYLRMKAGQMKDGFGDASAALQLADELADDRTAALAAMLQARCMWHIEPQTSQHLLDSAHERATRAGDELLTVWAAVHQAFLCVVSDRIAAGLALARETRSRALALGVPLFVAELCVTDGYGSLFRSDYADAIHAARELSRHADELDMVDLAGFADYLEALALCELGEHESSLAELPRAIDSTERAGYTIPAIGLRYAHSLHLLAAGRSDESEQILRQLVAITGASGFSSTVWCLVVLARIAQSRGEYGEAQRLIDQGYEIQDRVGLVYLRAWLDQRSASLARARGDLFDAETTIHRALALQQSNEQRAEIVYSLEILIGILTATRRMTDAARLAGAAQAERDRLGLRLRIPPEREIYAADLTAVEQALGVDAFAQAVAEGGAMSLDEAVSFAQRARGRRGRPAYGWDSLTPTEQDVVALITEGRTNVEIAQRLFMSRETVKTHLSHVYAKLHVRTRAQLAALAATRAAQQR